MDAEDISVYQFIKKRYPVNTYSIKCLRTSTRQFVSLLQYGDHDVMRTHSIIIYHYHYQ